MVSDNNKIILDDFYPFLSFSKKLTLLYFNDAGLDLAPKDRMVFQWVMEAANAINIADTSRPVLAIATKSADGIKRLSIVITARPSYPELPF